MWRLEGFLKVSMAVAIPAIQLLVLDYYFVSTFFPSSLFYLMLIISLLEKLFLSLNHSSAVILFIEKRKQIERRSGIQIIQPRESLKFIPHLMFSDILNCWGARIN